MTECEAGTIQELAPLDSVRQPQVSQESCKNMVQQLLVLEARDRDAPVWLYITSHGGDVYAGFGLYDTMQMLSCPVCTRN